MHGHQPGLAGDGEQQRRHVAVATKHLRIGADHVVVEVRQDARAAPAAGRCHDGVHLVIGEHGRHVVGAVAVGPGEVLDAALELAKEPLDGLFVHVPAHVVDVALSARAGQVVVARANLIDQLPVQGPLPVPGLTGGDALEVQRRSALGHELLEERMHVLELLEELLPALLRVLAEHRERALVLAGREHLDVDIVLLQESVHVRYLGNHPDGPDDRKGRCEHVVGHGGHHVAAAGGDLVHRNHKPHAVLTQAIELRGGEAIAVHGSAGTFEPYEHLVRRPGLGKNGRDLRAQVLHCIGLQVAFEIHDEQALAGAALACALHIPNLNRGCEAGLRAVYGAPGSLFRLLAGLGFTTAQLLEVPRGQQRLAHSVPQRVQAVVELADLEMTTTATATARAPGTDGRGDRQHGDDGENHGHGLREKNEILEEVIHEVGRFKQPATL